VSQISQGKTQPAGNGMPFTRAATRHWPIWGAPFGPVRKRLSALLCSFELAMASPAVARQAANRFLNDCILRYIIEGVLDPCDVYLTGSALNRAPDKHRAVIFDRVLAGCRGPGLNRPDHRQLPVPTYNRHDAQNGVNTHDAFYASQEYNACNPVQESIRRGRSTQYKFQVAQLDNNHRPDARV
jgi:hypothetical protein